MFGGVAQAEPGGSVPNLWQASLERPYLMPTFRSNTKKSPGGLGRGFEFGVVSSKPKVSQEGRRINKVASSRLSVAKCVSTALI